MANKLNGKFNNAKEYKAQKISFWDVKEAKWLFQKLQFYNLFIEKPSIKRLKNINLPHELTIYDKLSIEKISKAFKR